MEKIYETNDIDALLEELKGLAEDLDVKILKICPNKDINCIIGQLKDFYINLNKEGVKKNLLEAINKHINPNLTEDDLLNFKKPEIEEPEEDFDFGR